MRGQLYCYCAVSLLALAACRSHADQVAPPAPSAVSSPALAAPAPPPQPRAEPPNLPTNEDFEEAAARDISSKNLEQELDKLERELKEP